MNPLAAFLTETQPPFVANEFLKNQRFFQSPNFRNIDRRFFKIQFLTKLAKKVYYLTFGCLYFHTACMDLFMHNYLLHIFVGSNIIHNAASL